MSKVTNTSAQDPMITLLDMMGGGGPSGAIERSEARGQRELVNASVLPTDGLNDPCWAAMGIVIGQPVNGDPMFTEVQLPTGWSKRATDHSMWSELVDAKGRKRASIFYKAAFYDRSCRISVVRRFSIERDYDHRDAVCLRVLDAGTVVYSAMPIAVDPKDYKAQDNATQTATADCVAWLDDHGYSDYRNAAAYWG